MPSYWVKESDGRNKFPLKINSCNESAHLLRKLENFRHQQGIPVDENVKVDTVVIQIPNLFGIQIVKERPTS